MSIRYVAAVLDRLTELSESETLVLIALADFASDDTRECWPSMKTVARRARCDRRSARRIIRRLESYGLLESAKGGHQYGANTASCYRLRFDYDGTRLETTEAALSTRGTVSPPQAPKLSPRGTLGTPRGTLGPPKGDRRVPPSVIEPSLNQRAFDKRLKPKTVDNSGADRLEQLEALKKLQGTAA